MCVWRVVSFRLLRAGGPGQNTARRPRRGFDMTIGKRLQDSTSGSYSSSDVSRSFPSVPPATSTRELLSAQTAAEQRGPHSGEMLVQLRWEES
eukprot:COSAG06_NODE_868_length_11865_cov_6.316590_2_plen_93_part_00